MTSATALTTSSLSNALERVGDVPFALSATASPRTFAQGTAEKSRRPTKRIPTEIARVQIMKLLLLSSPRTLPSDSLHWVLHSRRVSHERSCQTDGDTFPKATWSDRRGSNVRLLDTSHASGLCALFFVRLRYTTTCICLVVYLAFLSFSPATGTFL